MLEHRRPRRVICVGDSFHDGRAAARLDPADIGALRSLTSTHEWIWVAGNHDPAPPTRLGGMVTEEFVRGPLAFRHRALSAPDSGEISGHFHPKASLRNNGRRVTGRCFVADGRRIILPAFGAYTGGCDVLEPEIAALFGGGFRVHLIGHRRVHTLDAARLRR